MSHESQEFIGEGLPSEKIKTEVQDLGARAIELEEKAQEARRQGKIKEATSFEEERKSILKQQREELQKRSRLKEHKL